MRVLIVTEIRLYRDGIAESLRRLDDVQEAVTAADGPAAIMAARRHECDVALLDMTIPDSTRIVQGLLAARPAVKVVALGVPEDGPQVVECAEAGICGYLSREVTLSELADGLRCALRGEAQLSGRVAAGLLRHIALQARARPASGIPAQLTPREREVLRMLVNGLTNKQIARALDLQLSTVKNHVHQVLTKFGVEARGDVVRAMGGASSVAARD